MSKFFRPSNDGPAKMKEQLLTIQEAAQFLGVATKTLRRWDTSGRLKPERTVGNQRRYTLSELQAFKLSKPVEPQVFTPKPAPSASTFTSPQTPATQGEGIVASPVPSSPVVSEPVTVANADSNPTNFLAKKNSEELSASATTSSQEPSSWPSESSSWRGPGSLHMPMSNESDSGQPASRFRMTESSQNDVVTTSSESNNIKNLSNFFSQPRFTMALAGMVSVVLIFSFMLFGLGQTQALGGKLFSFLPHNNKAADANANRSVLAAGDVQSAFQLKINVPSMFGKQATFLDSVAVKKSLTVDGEAVLTGGIRTENANIDAGTGTLTASNVIYSLLAGSNISITGDPQNPTIAADVASGVTSFQGQEGAVALASGTGIGLDGLTITNTGVLSVQGQSGAVAFTGGSGVAVSGTTISNTDGGSAQNIFKSIITPSTTIAANSNTDSLTFAAGSGITITGDAGSKTVTITSNASGTLSGLTTNGVLYATDPNNASSTLAGTTGTVLKGVTAGVPVFAAVDLSTDVTGVLSLARGGTGLGATPTNGQLLIGNGSGYTLGTITAGAGIGVSNGSGTISVTNNGVLSLTGTANQITTSGSTGAITLSLPQDIATTSTPTFASMTLTANTNQLTLGTGNTGVITLATLTGGRTYTLPDQSGEICLDTGNCPGGGGGTIGGSGTAGYLPRFSNATTLANSLLYDTGTKVGIGTISPEGLFSVSGGVAGQALVSLNETGNQNILTGSASGTTRFYFDQSGNLSLNGGGLQFNGVNVLSGSSLGSGITGSSLTSVSTLTAGAIGTGFGAIDIGTDAISGGDITSTGTTGITIAGNGAGITFSGTGNHIINASSGTLQIGATTLTGALNANSQNVTGINNLSAGGTITFGALSTGIVKSNGSGVLSSGAVDLATGDVTGTLGSGNGGTGLASYNTGDLLFASGANTLAARAIGTPGQILTVSGGVPVWMDAGGTINFWQRANGALAPINVTDDFIVGGSATASAKFQISGLTGDATTSGSLTFNTASSIQTTAGQTLTIGGATTGNIVLTPNNGSGLVLVNGNVSLATGNAYQINGANVLTSTSLGSGVTSSSLTSVGALASGSIANGFGSITTANTITGTTLNGTTGINTGAGAGTLRIDNNGNLSNIGTINASGAVTLSSLGTGVVQSNGSGLLSSAALNLAGGASYISGTLPVGNGGTGVTSVGSAGSVAYSNGTSYAFTSVGNGGQVLVSNGTGAPTWEDASAIGTNYWQRNDGTLSAINITDDLLVGGTSTASAKFQISGLSGNASTSGTLTFNTAGNIQTTANQTLTIGGASTGNIVLSPNNGSGFVSVNGNLNISSGNALQINGANVLTATALGSGVTGSSLTGVGALTSGSIASGFGTIFTTNTIQGSDITASGTTGFTATGSGADLAFTGGGTNIISSTSTLQINAFTLGGAITGNSQNVTGLNNLSAGGTITFGGLNTANGLLYTNGSGVISQAAAGTTGQLLVANGSGTPVFVTLGTDATVTDTGALTIAADAVALGTDTTGNYVATLTSGNGITASATGEGSTPTLSLGALTANWDQTGAFDIVLNNAGSELQIKESAGDTYFGTIDVGDLTDNRTYTFPDFSGTVCLSIGNCDGGSGGSKWQVNGNVLAPFTVGNQVVLGGNTATDFQFEVNGTRAGKALVSFNETGDQNILTASASGSTVFNVTRAGNLQMLESAGSFFGTLAIGDLAADKTYVLPNFTGTTADICLSTGNCAGSGGGLTGSGTAGQIAFFTDSDSVSSDTTGFAWDATNDRLGIGNDTPTARLDVAGANLGKALVIFDETGDQNILTGSASGTTRFSFDRTGNLNLVGGGYQISGTNVLTSTALGSSVVGSSLTSVGALTGGSIASGFGTIATSNTITGTTINGTTGINTGATAGTQRIDASGNLVNIGTINASGTLTFGNYTTDGGLLYTNGSGVVSQTATGSLGECLISNAGGAPTWGSCAGGVTNYWQRNSGTLAALNITDDILVGGVATDSAKFQVFGTTGNATTSGTLTFNTAGNIQTTNNQTLTFGGASTGNIVFSPLNGAGTVTSTGTLTLASGKTYQINGADVLSSTTLGSSVLSSSLTSVGALTGGSIASGFGTITTGNTITGTTLNGTTGINTGAGAGTLRIDANGNLSSIGTITASGAIRFSNLGVGVVQSDADGDLSSGALDLAGGTNYVTGVLSAANGGTGDDTSGTTGVPYISSGNWSYEAQLSSARGGTGANLSAANQGAIPYFSSTGVMSALAPSTAGYVLTTGGAGANPSWTDAASLGTNYFQRNLGAVSPLNITDDLLVGGNATASAKFQIFGLSGNATTSGSLTFNTASSIQTTTNQTLTIGGNTTGNITLSPLNGNGSVTSTGDLNLASGKGYQINGTNVLTSTALGSSVVGSSLTSVGALTGGSIGSGFGTIATANTITGTTLNGTTGINTGAGAGTQRIDTNGNLVAIGTIDSTFLDASANVVNLSASTGLQFNGTSVINASRQLENITGLSTSLTPTAANTYALGTGAGNQFSTIYGQNLYQNGNLVCDTSGNCSGLTTTYWNQNNGAISAKNSTVDLLVGGASTESAKFAVLNVNNGTPTASVSAGTAGAAYLTAAGTLQTTANQTLTIGGATTGNITLSPLNGSGTVTSTGNLNLVTGKAYQINGVDVLTSAALGSGITGSSLTQVGALSSGSIASGFGTIATANTITGTTLNGTTGINTGAGAGTIRIDNNGNLSNIGTINASGAITLSNLGAGIVKSTAGGLLSSAALNLASGTEVTGTLGVGNGGTGFASYATGDLLVGNGSSTLSKLAIGSDGQVLSIAGGTPSWISSSSLNFWQRANGAIAPLNITDDLLLGATATGSAKFAFTNIAGGTPTASISANSGNNAAYLNGLGVLGTTNAQTLTLGSASTGNVSLSPGGTNVLTATANGRVGIGTTTPDDDLTIEISSPSFSNALTLRNASGGADRGVSLRFANNNVLLGLIGAVRGDSDSTSALIFETRVANTLAERMRIDVNGNLGIGTTAPTATLDVNGAASVSGSLNFRIGAGEIQTTANNTLSLGGNTTGNILLNSDGNDRVGIGTASPSRLLHLASSVGTSTGIQLDSLGAGGRNYSITSTNNGSGNGGGKFSIYDETAFSNRFIIDSSGNIGIGSDNISPLAKLDVRGSSGTQPVASFSGQTANAGLVVDNNGVGDLFTASKSGATKFTILNNGNVQINNLANCNTIDTDANGVLSCGMDEGAGATANLWQLNDGAVSPFSSTADLLIGGTSTSSAKFAFINSLTGTPTASISANSGNNAAFLTGAGVLGTTNAQTLTLGSASTGNVSLAPGGTNVLTATANGRIGIGTTTPGSRFHIEDAATTSDSSFYLNRTGTSGLLMQVQNNGSNVLRLFDDGSLDIDGNFSAGGSGLFNGPVSLTTGSYGTNPAKLHIDEGTGQAVNLKFTAGSTTGTTASDGLDIGVTATGIGQINQRENLSLYFGTNNTTRMEITNSGSVIIGAGAGGGAGEIVTIDNAGNITAGETIGATFLEAFDGLSVDTNLLFVDATVQNGNVGIGTTNALAKLDVRGLSGTQPVASFSGQTSNAGLIVDNNGVGDLFTASKSGATKFVINNAGDVGIGIARPTAELQDSSLRGSLATYGYIQAGGNGAGKAILSPSYIGNSGALGFYDSSGNNQGNIANSGNGLEIGANSSSYIALTGGFNGSTNVGINVTSSSIPRATLDVRGNSGTTPIASFSGQTSNAGLIVDNNGVGDLFTASKSGATKFVINNAGNVGIGTSTPASVLDVRGNARIGDGTNYTSIDADGDLSLVGTSDYLVGNNRYAFRYSADEDLGLFFNTANGRYDFMDATASRLFSIDAANGNLYTTGGLQFGSFVAAGGVLYTNGTGNVAQTAQGVSGQCLQSQGVGGAPVWGSCDGAGSVNSFTIANGLLYNSNLTTDFAIGGNSSESAKFKVSISGTNPTASVSGSTSNAALIVDNTGVGDLFTASKSGATKFVINNAGNVGIGTSTPGTTLDVAGTFQVQNSATPLFYVNPATAKVGINTNSVFSNVDFQVMAPSSSVVMSLIRNDSTTSADEQLGSLTFGSTDATVFSAAAVSSFAEEAFTGSVNGSNLRFYTTSLGASTTSERLRIAANGNFGFNTTTPLASYDFRGVSGTTPVASVSGTTSNASLIVDNNGVGDLFTASKSGATKFTITNSGTVGIGQFPRTTSGNSPEGTLHLWGLGTTGSEAVMYFGDRGQAGNPYIREGGSGDTDRLELGGRLGVVFATGSTGTERMRVDSNGNVLINTTSALATFDVRGISGTTAVASVSGQTTNAALIVDNNGLGDLFTASKSGAMKFAVLNNGDVQIANLTTAGGVLYTNGTGTIAQTAQGVSGQCLQSQGVGGAPAWGSCDSVASVNAFTTTNGLVHNGNLTTDFAIGGNSSESAKFRVSISGTNPTASVSANTSFAGLVVDQAGTGDLFTASKSGLTKFRIDNSGNLTVNGAATFQDGSNSSTAFQVKNAAGQTSLGINNVQLANLIGNPSMEASTSGWFAKGTGTIALEDNKYLYGTKSLKIVTGTVADNGAQYRVPFRNSTQYSLSLWMRRDTSTTSTINIGRQDNAVDVNCLTGQTVTTTWTQYTCTFTTGATINGSSNIYVKQTDTTTDTLYVDGVSLVQSSSAQVYTAPADNLQIDSAIGNVTLNASGSAELQPWQNNVNSLPTNLSAHGTVTANGYVYVIGGTNGSAQTAVYYAKVNADGSLGSWVTNSNSLPAARSDITPVIANGYVYVFGGFNTTSQSTVYYAKLNADGSIDTWKSANALPGARYGSANVSANGYVYVIGGYSTAVESTIYYAKVNADGTLGAWVTSSPSFPDALSFSSATVANGYIYHVGGFDGLVYTSAVYASKLNANGTLGAWSLLNPLPLPDASGAGASFVVNGHLYATVGYDGAAPSSTIYYTRLTNNGGISSWVKSKNSLPAALYSAGYGLVNGYIYIVGGNNATTHQNTVYYSSTSRVQLSGSLDLIGLGGGSLSDGYGTGGSIYAGNIFSNGNLEIAGNTRIASGLSVVGETSLTGGLNLQGVSGTTPIASISGNTAFAGLVLDNNGTGDIFTASKSGATKFTILNNGNVRINNLANCNTIDTDANGVLSCGTDEGGGATQNYFQLNDGAVSPFSNTADLLVGGTSTASAKFAFINNLTGTPTASISANSGNNATYLTGLGVLSTTNAQTLTLGSSSTGNIIIDSGSGITQLADNTLQLTGSAPAISATTTDAGISVTTNGTGALGLDTGTTGTINIGAGTGAKTVNLGTGGTGLKQINIGGTAANIIGLGNTQTAGAINLGAAMTTGTITIGGTGLQTGTIGVGTGTGAQILNLGTGGTGIKTINIGGTAANVIGLGNTQTAGSINLGAAMTTGTITIGGTGLQTGTIGIGTGTGAQILNLGTGGTGIKTINLGGTAANVIGVGNTQTGGSISLGTAMTTGTISIGGTGAQTGTISLGAGTGAQIVNLATGGTGIKTINLGTGAAANVLTVGTTNTTASTTILAGSGNITLGNNTGNGNVVVNPNAGGNAALIVNKQGPNGDVFTASGSGTTFFTVRNNGVIQMGNSTDGLSFDYLNGGPIYSGRARPAKQIVLSPEYSGGIITASGSATTDGDFTADASASASTPLITYGGFAQNYLTYYEWSSLETSLQDYTVGVRVTLPADFSSWAPGGSSIQVVYNTELTTTDTSKLDFYLYPSSSSTPTVYRQAQSSSTARTWRTLDIPATDLTDGTAFNTASQSAMIYMKMSSKDNNHIQISDIILNYLSKF